LMATSLEATISNNSADSMTQGPAISFGLFMCMMYIYYGVLFCKGRY
jgi:hypothetical protein